MEDNQIIVDVGISALIQSLKHLQKQYELNEDALKEMAAAGKEQSEAYILLTQEQKVLRQQLSSTEKTMQNEIKMQQAQEGSLVQLRAQLANLNKQYDSMSGMERMGEAGTELQGKIKALHDQILGLEGDTGRMQRNVGNYPEAVKPVQAQIRELTQQLIQLRAEGKQNTEEYRNLVEQTGKLKDAMLDAQREVKQMASDTGALNTVLDGAKAAAGAFSVALGVMNLVGDKDSETAKELAEAQAKLQSAIAITTGLQAVQNALQKESALMMGVSKIRILAASAAQRAYAAATRDATAAQEVFNKVAKSNVYVWLAGIILSVVGAIAAFRRGSKEQKDQLEETNIELQNQVDIIQKQQEAYDSLNKRITDSLENNIEKLKAQGATTEQIRAAEDALFETRKREFDEEGKRLKREEMLYGKRVEQYENNIKLMNDLSERRLEFLQKGDEKAAKFYQNEINNLQKVMDAQKKHIDLMNDFWDRRDKFYNQRRQQEAERKREDEAEIKMQRDAAKAAFERWKQEIQAVREANKELVETTKRLDSTDISMREWQKDIDKTTEAIDKLSKKLNSLKDAQKFASEILKDVDFGGLMDKLERKSNPLYNFAETYKENADVIQETSAALESSFSSLSSMYQQMANDESKTEEERAKAAQKAKNLAKIQIAASGSSALAKGIAGAMDAKTLAGKFAALATMTASIIAAIAQAKSLLEAHEGGGVIGGKFTGATRGSDNVLMTGRRGELVLNADQQKTLYDIANGNTNTNIAAELAAAIREMPAPVLVYEEYKKFTDRVLTLDNAAKLQ